jgi:DNA-binding CsgD family transcriptional regulator
MVADEEEDVSTAVNNFIERLASAHLEPDVTVEPAPETAADRRRERIGRPQSRYDDKTMAALGKAIVRLFVDEDLAAPVVAERLGVSPATVYNYLRRSGVKRKQTGRRRTGQSHRDAHLQARRQMVRHLYENERLVIREIAENLGIHEATVHKDLRALKVPSRGRGGMAGKGIKADRARARREDVKQLWAEGRKTSEIAEVLKVSRSTIQNDMGALREAGELADAPTGRAGKNVAVMLDRAIEQMSNMAELLLGQNLSGLDLPPEKVEALEQGLSTIGRSVAYARRSIRKGS